MEDPAKYVGDVPKSLPALLRAEKTLKRIKGFDKSLNDKAVLVEKITKVIKDIEGGCDKESYKKLLIYVVNLLSVEDICAEDLAIDATDELILFFANLIETVGAEALKNKGQMSDY